MAEIAEFISALGELRDEVVASSSNNPAGE